jgi:hypothetical protein
MNHRKKHSKHNPLVGLCEQICTPTADWCEENIYLSSRVPTVRPGQWRVENSAAVCRPGGVLEALDDPDVESVVVAKGSQTGLTTTAYCWLAKCMCTDPASALIVMNSTQDARDKSAETWRPIWEDSPALRSFLPACLRKDWTKLYQLINRSPVYWIGANSPGRLGAKPIRRLILDEVDKYPDRFGGGKERREAGASALAEQRVKTFRDSGLAKILKFSTPTVETGEVQKSYIAGDQRKLCVKCHACRAEQIMAWSGFKINMELAKTDPGAAVAGAHYACVHCGAPWSDQQRWAAIDKGVWKPTVTPQDPRCRSFHVPSWLSKLVKIEYLAAQWIKAQSSQSALQDFINSECGEPFLQIDNRIKDAVFAELEGEYAEGDKPFATPIYLTDSRKVVFGGCDVQKGYLVPVFRQFTEGGDSGLIWAGDIANFHELDKLAERFGAEYVIVDCRYRTREVQEWAAEHAGYIPSMGVVRRGRVLFSYQQTNIDEGRRSGAGRMITTIDYDADMLKDILALQIQKREGGRRWMIPRGYAANKTYVEQMIAERLVNGRWLNPQGRPNHYWDAECLTLLAAIASGIFGNQYQSQDAAE